MRTTAVLLTTLVTLTLADLALAKRGRDGRCRYDRKAAEWSDCDANKVTKTMPLKRGQDSSCPSTKTIEKPCTPGKARKDKCRYDGKAAQWSECDAATNTRTKTIRLKRGPAETCEPSKTIEKPCSGGSECEYERVVSDCTDNKKTISYKVVKGDETTCIKASKDKPCGGGNKAERKATKKAKKLARKAARQNRRENNKDN